MFGWPGTLILQLEDSISFHLRTQMSCPGAVAASLVTLLLDSLNFLHRLRCWTRTCFWHPSPWSTLSTSQKRITLEKRTSGKLGFFSLPGCFCTFFYKHSEILTLIVVCPRLARIKEWVDAHDPGALVIPLSGAFESKLLDMEEEEKNKYCEEQKTQRWGTDSIWICRRTPG